jgi:hypothetical protein
MTTKEKYAIIENSCKKHFDFLTAMLNYEISIEENDFSQPTTLQFIKIKLQNTLIDRYIFFMYQPFNGAEYTTLSIKSESSHNYSIYIDSYVKFNKTSFSKIWNLSSMTSCSGSNFTEKTDSYFSFMENLLKNELREVVEGKKWINLPTDWEAIGK